MQPVEIHMTSKTGKEIAKEKEKSKAGVTSLVMSENLDGEKRVISEPWAVDVKCEICSFFSVHCFL